MTGSNLWEKSSLAWIKSLGENGDFGRAHVLDTPMIERVKALAPANALDVGCGEGRFCRFMQKLGIKTTGVDPTQSLISEARRRDSLGDYRLETAENMVIEPHSFDLVVSYLSFIDISDIASAIAKMVHALRPGGALLVANLNSFNTAAMPDGWHFDNQARARFSIDYYLEERAIPVAWRGISVENWHRPFETYVQLLLGHGMILTHFAEPRPTGGDAEKQMRHSRVPYFHIMEWRKLA